MADEEQGVETRKKPSLVITIAVVAVLTEPTTLTLLQRHGSKTQIRTAEVRIEPRASKGNMLVAVVLDDDVVGME